MKWTSGGKRYACCQVENGKAEYNGHRYKIQMNKAWTRFWIVVDKKKVFLK